LILLTPHPGGLDYNLNQNSHYSFKKKSFDKHSKFVWQNLDSAKARLAYGEHFSLKWVQQWVKKKTEN
jgi:hypothetical protein